MLIGDYGAQSRWGRAVGRKDSLKGKCNSALGHTCHLDSTFLLWVNAPSSVDITGDIQPVFAYPAPLSSAPLTPPTCPNLGAPATLLLVSVLILHSFIKYWTSTLCWAVLVRRVGPRTQKARPSWNLHTEGRRHSAQIREQCHFKRWQVCEDKIWCVKEGF